MQNHWRQRQTGVRERRELLGRLEKWILAHRREIQEALSADFGKPAFETDISEIWATLTEIRHARKNLARWMKPRKVKPTLVTLTATAWTEYQPKGVVLVISPWNYPFQLAVVPLALALAAGNCVMVKPSEKTPQTSALLERMATELFPPELVAVVTGGVEVGMFLVGKAFHHIYFTGGSRVGRLIMKAAAENLSSVTLELGGKSPFVVTETANLKDAAQKLAFLKFLNSGQTCIAPDYLLIHSHVKEKFLKILRSEFQNYPTDKKFRTEIIDESRAARLESLKDEALAKGARKIPLLDAADEADESIPLILDNVQLDFQIMGEEIFGPFLPVLTFDNLDEAIDIIRRIPSPLAIYLFTANREEIQKVKSGTLSGGLVVNDVVFQYIHPNLPFGGVGESGIGRTHGLEGFAEFSNKRSFLKNYSFSPLKFFMPPLKGWKLKLVDWLIRWL